MKRRVIILILVLVYIVLSVSSLAEEFSFRNGVTWGMSQDEVNYLEGNQNYTAFGEEYYGVENVKFIEYNQIKAGGETATVAYHFIDDALIGICLVFNNDIDAESLVLSYTTKYGEPIQPDTDRFLANIAISMPGREGIYSFFVTMSQMEAWEAPSTYILFLKDMNQVFYFGEDEIPLHTLHVNSSVNIDGI